MKRAPGIVDFDCLPPHRRHVRVHAASPTTMVWPSVGVGFLVLGVIVTIACWVLFASLG